MSIPMFPEVDKEGGIRQPINRSRVERDSTALQITRWMTDESGFDFRRHRTLTSLFFFFFFWCASGALSHRIQWMAHEADKSLPSSTKFKNVWSCTATSPTCLMTWCWTKHTNKFIFTWRRIGVFKMHSKIGRWFIASNPRFLTL